MAGISSLGIGSGLDLSGLVENLLNAERAPVQNSLDRQQGSLTTELSGIGIFRGAISSFRSSLSGLGAFENYSTRSSTNSNPDALSASISNDAAVGSYDIDITNLAEKHALASDAFASLDEVVGSGNLQIKFGTITGPGFSAFTADNASTIQNITIDSSNNTLSGLKNYINNGNYGVNASIINDGSGYRLTLQSEHSGENAAMEITVTDTGDANNVDANGLSRLAFNASATQMTQTRAAEDATVLINGITVTSADNTLQNTIEGVTLTLAKETAGTPFIFSVAKNTASASEAIHQVVDGYNGMIASLNELSQVGIDGAESGILVGDSVLRSFTSNIRALMTGKVSGLSGSITALSTIGIKTQSDGTLSVDDAALGKALDENPLDALALLAQVGKTSDAQVKFDDFTAQTRAGLYDVNVSQVATQSILNGATGLTLPITVDANNDNITFRVDGITTGSLTLTQGSYTTGDEFAAEMQSRINTASTMQDAGISVSVSFDSANNGLVITSNQYGSESQIEITAVDTNTTADFGLSVAAATIGQDVAGTIGGLAAIGEGQTLTGSAGAVNGLSLTVTDGATGARGNVRFTRGLVESMNDLIASYLDSDGILSTKENGLNASLDEIQTQRANLEDRLATLQTRYIAQFSALDALVSRFQTMGNYLSQQIDSLPGSGQLLNKK